MRQAWDMFDYESGPSRPESCQRITSSKVEISRCYEVAAACGRHCRTAIGNLGNSRNDGMRPRMLKAPGMPGVPSMDEITRILDHPAQGIVTVPLGE